MSKRKEKSITPVVVVMLAGLLLICGLWFAAMNKAVMIRSLPECVTEDQTYPDCKWSPDKHGNGKGRSFYVKNGVIHYI